MTTQDIVGDTEPLKAIERDVTHTLEDWTAESRVYWSAPRNAWVVTGYAEATKILESAAQFWRDVPEREGSSEFWGRHLMMLEGTDHRRMHSFHMKLTGKAFAEKIRERAGEVCRRLSADLVTRGRADLSTDYADSAVLVIGCDFMGYDVTDRALMDELDRQMSIRAKWKEALLAGSGIKLDSDIARNGQAALAAIEDLLMPTIRERRETPRDDLVSQLWEQGQAVFPDWSERDILSTGWSCLDNEGKPLLRGLLYILAQDRKLQAKLRRDSSRVPAFVEEGLRFLSPLRTMQRIAKQDIEIGGQRIRTGETVYLITPVANRDPARWACPYSFDTERSNDTINLAFGYGAGYCVGRFVGRMEAEEAIKALLAKTSRFTLDTAGAPPEWAGDFAHSVSPVHAILE